MIVEGLQPTYDPAAHPNADRLVSLALAGQAEPTQVTQSHPYWSLDRWEFIPAGQLRSGEREDTLAGETTVESVVPLDYTGLVYNLETTVHVYRVDSLGTLVQNSGNTPCTYTVAQLKLSKATARQRLNTALGSIAGDGLAGHHLLPLDAISDVRTASVIEAAARGGFSMNGANNGVLLSELFHRGCHPRAIERMIRKISGLKGSDTEIAQAVQSTVNAEREFLLRIEAKRLEAWEAGKRIRIFVK